VGGEAAARPCELRRSAIFSELPSRPSTSTRTPSTPRRRSGHRARRSRHLVTAPRRCRRRAERSSPPKHSPGRGSAPARCRSAWASWGLGEATLKGRELAVSTGCPHEVAMSAQCYPIWPVNAITSFMSTQPDTSWVPHARLPAPPDRIGGPDGGLHRITKWHLTVRGRHLRLPFRRSLPSGLIGHYGPMQCCLSSDMARWIVGEVDL